MYAEINYTICTAGGNIISQVYNNGRLLWASDTGFPCGMVLNLCCHSNNLANGSREDAKIKSWACVVGGFRPLQGLL